MQYLKNSSVFIKYLFFQAFFLLRPFKLTANTPEAAPAPNPIKKSKTDICLKSSSPETRENKAKVKTVYSRPTISPATIPSFCFLKPTKIPKNKATTFIT